MLSENILTSNHANGFCFRSEDALRQDKCNCNRLHCDFVYS